MNFISFVTNNRLFKMFKLTFVVLIALMVISGNSFATEYINIHYKISYYIVQAENCPPNEVFNACGTACPVTCANKDNPPMICTMQCVIGCFCARGYLRNDAGTCVPESQC